MKTALKTPETATVSTPSPLSGGADRLMSPADYLNAKGFIGAAKTGMVVELDRLRVCYGSLVAVRDVSVRIEPGEFFSFLGPSGCGKTTLLRAISGFVEPTSGSVRIDGRDLSGTGPNERPTAMIFQNLALFPQMRVWENIAFALEVRRVDRATRRKRAEELLELVDLTGQGDKYIQQLSGGQQQRVAIARALAAEPQVLLLDEPLSSLDLKLRQRLCVELRNLQRRVGLTFIYITHDQGEALTLSDRLAVMRDGKIEQVGNGRSVYDDPVSTFVASFVGENNCLPGKLRLIRGSFALVDTAAGPFTGRIKMAAAARVRPGDAVMLFVRPEAIRILRDGNEGENTLTVRMISEDFQGHACRLSLTGTGLPRLSMLCSNCGTEDRVMANSLLRIGFESSDALVLPEGALANTG